MALQVYFPSIGGAHRHIRVNYPLERGAYMLDVNSPSPFTLHTEQTGPLPTQTDVVMRYDDGSASVVQLRGRLPEGVSAGDAAVSVLEASAPSGEPNLTDWDPDVLGVAASRYGILLIAEDYFGNRYYAPLTRDLSEMVAGARSAKFDVYGPNTIRAELPAYMLPAPEALFPKMSQQMKSFGMVANFLTTHAESSVIELDFKWANASGDDPTGLLQFKSLSLLVPQNFQVRPRVHLPTFQPGEEEILGYTSYHLIAPNSDGKMHLLGQNQHKSFRLLVFEHDAGAEADAVEDGRGWSSCPDLWGTTNRMGFNIGGFPIPDLNHIDPNWWAEANFERAEDAFVSGTPYRDPLGNTLGGDGRIGPFPVIGASYGGQTSGTDKNFWAGMIEASAQSYDGVRAQHYISIGYHNRMEDGCVWDADCRANHRLVNENLETEEYKRWRNFDHWQKRSWSGSDPNASKKDQDAPFGFSDVQSLHDLTEIDFQAANAQVIPEAALPSYMGRLLYDPRNDYNGYMRIDAQHLIRTVSADEALIYLDNDALAKHNIEDLAFCARLMYFDGKDGRLRERANPNPENVGTDLARGPSHCAHAWALCWHVATGETREVFADCLALYLQAHQRNMTATGSANCYKSGKTLTDFHPSGQWAVMRTNEVAYAVYVLAAMYEMFPDLAPETRDVLEQTLNDYCFTHAWMKQGGSYLATTWTHVAMAPKAQANDPNAFYQPGEHPLEQFQVAAGSFGANLLLAVGLKLRLPLAESRLLNMYGEDPQANLESKGYEWLPWTRAGLLAMVQYHTWF